MRLTLLLASLVAIFFSGCVVPTPTPSTGVAASAPEAQTLREGDQIKIMFPGAANLDTVQQIRRDGRITMPIIGELFVVGLKPSELETTLADKYATQLVSKEVTVQVVSSTFSVYISGAVLHPGKVEINRPLTALEAIMESGGFDSTKADTKAVRVLRIEGGITKTSILDLGAVIEGTNQELFYLKPSDIVFVPEKFQWF